MAPMSDLITFAVGFVTFFVAAWLVLPDGE